ncbi:hypothetical protein D0Z00_004595 [Geotrichum galactomycetum]|uniref:Uncharacterized protein n=1 Tax=Geotrichum galactomycetum TaxID=27317 RepID=A0ACB6UY05_9ASCO|nr:hypothetical protein D0Z00_004595 [Geotrichum candidum]
MAFNDNTPIVNGSPSSIILFIALGVGIVFVNIVAIAGLKYFWRRRRVATTIIEGPATSNSIDASIGHDRLRSRSLRRRKKILKLMTQAQVDAKFPTKTYKQAVQESPLHRTNEKSGGIIVQENSIQNDSISTYDQEDALIDKSHTTKHNQAQTRRQPSQSNRLSLTIKRLVNRASNSHVRDSNISNNSINHPINTPHASEEIDLGENGRLHHSDVDLEAQTAPSPNHRQITTTETQSNEQNKQQQNYPNCLPLPSRPATLSNNTQYDSDMDTDNEDDDSNNHHHPAFPSEGALDMCAICIEDFEESNIVRLLPCGHIFHPECIDPWFLTRQARCPLCKANYYAPKPEDPLGPDPVEVLEQRYLEQQRQRAREAREQGESANPPPNTSIGRRLSNRLWGSRRTTSSSRENDGNELESVLAAPSQPSR